MMGTNFSKIVTSFTVILLCFVTGLFCTKSERLCAKKGVEYMNTDNRCYYSPAADSLPLGESLILTAAVPKTFFDTERNHITTNSQADIVGSIGIVRLSPDIKGAMNEMILTAEKGKIIKDSVQFTSGQLEANRTTVFTGNSTDSFRMKLIIKPLNRGIYAIALGSQGTHDVDCAGYKYFLNVGNTDQHLNYILQVTNGYLSDYERNYAYCIKIY
jgi:hypothetical protein